ncbi:hypothetical protein AOLI_G00257850 [Acnodon oligacanthus]
MFFSRCICSLTLRNFFHGNAASAHAPALPLRSWCFSAVDTCLLVIYVMEAVLKILVWIHTYFRNPWNDSPDVNESEIQSTKKVAEGR